MRRDPFQHIIDDALLKYPEPLKPPDRIHLENWQLQIISSLGDCRENIEELKHKISLLGQAVSNGS